MVVALAGNTCIGVTNAPLQMIKYQQDVIPKWLIEGHQLYFIDDKNKVRNMKSGKVLQMQLKGYTKGYYLNGRFLSLKQIRPLLKNIYANDCLFDITTNIQPHTRLA